VASEIAVALISGGSASGGAIVGSSGAIVGSLVAQRAEKRRRRQESRAALIAQWRNDIRQLRNAEINHLARAGLAMSSPAQVHRKGRKLALVAPTARFINTKPLVLIGMQPVGSVRGVRTVS
jgi:hypothetical protein